MLGTMETAQNATLATRDCFDAESSVLNTLLSSSPSSFIACLKSRRNSFASLPSPSRCRLQKMSSHENCASFPDRKFSRLVTSTALSIWSWIRRDSSRSVCRASTTSSMLRERKRSFTIFVPKIVLSPAPTMTPPTMVKISEAPNVKNAATAPPKAMCLPTIEADERPAIVFVCLYFLGEFS